MPLPSYDPMASAAAERSKYAQTTTPGQKPTIAPPSATPAAAPAPQDPNRPPDPGESYDEYYKRRIEALSHADNVADPNSSAGKQWRDLAREYQDQNNRKKWEADQASRKEQSYYSDVGAKFGTINADNPDVQKRAGAIGDLYTNEVDRGAAMAGHAAAAGASRRGLTGDGYSETAQQSIVQLAAGQRAQMREAALREAIGEGQKSLMGEAQIHGMGDPMLMQLGSNANMNYMQALQLAAEERAANAKSMAALGGLFIDPLLEKGLGYIP